MNEQRSREGSPASIEPTTKQAWETPVLEEIDYEETAAGYGFQSFDGAGYSGQGYIQ